MASQWHARSDRPVTLPFLRYGIAEQVRRLEEEPVWASGTRNAITLTKEPGLRVVLTILKPHTKVHEHQASGPLTIHVISGRLDLHAAGQSVVLGPGEVAVLESAVAHELEALEKSAFLLTIAAAA
jgi:quercetin dioxygenase-like cupin family protein